jgi:pimeloyl-ACP methyl ester carboxylesterase
MQLRTADMNFVIDTIKTAKADGALGSAWHTETADEALSVLARTDTDHIGLIGHSMGGATAEALGRTRSDVGAVIILDGTMLSDLTGFENGVYTYNEAPYPVPVLDFGKKSDYDGSEQQYENVNDFVIRNARDGRKVLFDGVAHMDFTDLPLFSPFLASMLGSEKIDHAAFMNKVNGLVLNWFDYYLKGKGTLNIPAAD